MALARCSGLFVTKKLLSPFSACFQHGYVILLPEIGEETPDKKNPLYQNDGLPQFNEITIENCRAAISKQALDFEIGVQDIEKKIEKNSYKDVFKDIIEPLEKIGNPLDTTWGLSKTLYLGNNTLMPTSSYVAMHERARRARAAKFTSKKIYSAIKKDLSENNETERTEEQNRVLRKFAVEGKLNGLELDEKTYAEFNNNFINSVKAQKDVKLKNDVATKQHAQLVRDPAIVRDFPDELLKAIAVDPNNYTRGPWRFTLQPNTYLPLLEHCPDREIRWILWKADVNRGSVTGEQDVSTSLNVEQIRGFRANMAQILGYKNYVDMSMQTKMAGSKEEVDKVLNLLLERAKLSQDEEINNLLNFANDKGFKTDQLEAWDIPYWRSKQRKNLFQYNENQLKDFFPLNTVLNGLFELCERLFGVVIKVRNGINAWHKDVRFYDIFESHSSAPVASFYLDPYARSEDKFRNPNTGWMIGMQNKSQITDSKPLAALIFNFEPPTGEKESHLTFNEVKILFQKFGHSLQHLLTRTYYSEVAGFSFVEWDAVEVSGHMLSHWLFNEKIIESISCHCGSGDKLPKSMFEKLCQSQKHLSGYDLCNEIYLAVLDLELHSSPDYWLDITKRLWPKYKCVKHYYKFDAQPCNFMDIFTEQWGAAYYSHLWARMMAADVFSAFYEAGDNEEQIKDVGKRYKNTFLALGGSRHASQIFREFRGRDPSHKALLNSLGLKKVTTTSTTTINKQES